MEGGRNLLSVLLYLPIRHFGRLGAETLRLVAASNGAPSSCSQVERLMQERKLASTLVLSAAVLVIAGTITLAYVFVIDVADRKPIAWFFAEGIETPASVPAARAEIDGEAEVIGVEVAGEARAYVLDAFQPPSAHVVNDVVANRAISVAYCPSCDCIQVFGGEQGAQPLRLHVGGLYGNQMLLSWRGYVYTITSLAPLDGGVPPFPYGEFPFERTTWTAWVAGHPETDVYLGAGGSS